MRNVAFFLFAGNLGSTRQYPKVPSGTQQYPADMGNGDYKLAWLPSLPLLRDQLISIKLAFSCMKLVQNYKVIILGSGSNPANIFLSKVKILFGLATFKTEYFLLSERFYIKQKLSITIFDLNS